MSSREYTVQDRADIILAAMPSRELTNEQLRQLNEIIYTLMEAGRLGGDADDDAPYLWGAVELVRAGKFTREMRL